MIKNKSSIQKPEINLNGPDGNAFVLLGYAYSYCKQLSLPWKKIKADMVSSNYEHLISVFDKCFGAYIDLIRSNNEIKG